MRLRRIVLAAAVLAITVLGNGCGFELRRAPSLRFETLQLKGFKDASPLAREVVLEALTDEREKSVVASTAAGQVRELQLRARFQFRVRSPAGKDLLPATEILLSRDMSYNESNALAKEHEEASLYAAMQSDIVAQVLRRLAAVPAL
jgi:LPS-assembly lipoprotein